MGKVVRKSCNRYLKSKARSTRYLSEEMANEFVEKIQSIIQQRKSPKTKIIWYRWGTYGNKLYKGLLN